MHVECAQDTCAPSKSALIYLFVDVILTLGAGKVRLHELAPARRSPQGGTFIDVKLAGEVTHAFQPATGQGQAKQPVHGSRHVFVDCVFYLAKKEQHSINVLVLVALNGTILWLSSSNGGGTNNLDLACCELAKWAIHFDADEHGVANASFNGTWSSLSPVLLTTSFLSCQGLDVDGVYLLTLPTYSAESQAAYQRFSSVRIIVEQVIGKIKDWAAARETLRLPTTNTADLLDFHYRIWTVVAVFVNLFRTAHT